MLPLQWEFTVRVPAQSVVTMACRASLLQVQARALRDLTIRVRQAASGFTDR